MLKLENVSFSYGKKQVLKDFSLTLASGELLCVMGPSGCGKSTLLHLAAGLQKPSGGNLQNNATQTAYVFQEPRLFPWLTVAENIRAVLPKNTDNETLIDESLALVGLTDAKTLYPSALSGGMRSRASLARALAYGGDLFLLDEPFAALHEELCLELAEKLRNELKQRSASAILVTHRRADAEVFGDRILEMK